MIAAWAVAVSFASVARLERPCAGPADCARRLEDRDLPHAARSTVVQWALRGPGPGYAESLAWLVAHEDGRGPSDALEAVASGTDPQSWPPELRSALAFHRARWLARNGHPDRAIRLLQGDTNQRALLLVGTIVGQSADEGDRIAAVRVLAEAARHPDGDPDNRDLALVNAARVVWALGRPDVARALFTDVDPDGAHAREAARGAAWCDVALGSEQARDRLAALDADDPDVLFLSGVLAVHEQRLPEAVAARDALGALVEREAAVVDTVAALHGTLAWAAWESLRSDAPAALQVHLDARASDAPVDEVVAEFGRAGHRPDLGSALHATLGHTVDRLGTAAAGAAAERRGWRDAEAYLNALVASSPAPSGPGVPAPGPSAPVFPLRAGGGWGAPADVADGSYAGPVPSPRAPDRPTVDGRLFDDPAPEPGHVGLSVQGGPHPWLPGHHLVRLTVTAPEGRSFEARQGVTLGVTFDRGAVRSARRAGGDAPSFEAVAAVRAGSRAAVLFDVTLAESPGDTLATVTLTARGRGGPAETWAVPVPVALVNPLADAGDRRHLLIAAVGARVGEQLVGSGVETRWDVLADGPPAPAGSDVAALMEVIVDTRASASIAWDG